MQLDVPITLDGIVSVIGFGAAVVYQSATLRRNLESISQRISTVESEIRKLTDILIQQESLQQKLNALTERMERIESLVTTAPSRRATKR